MRWGKSQRWVRWQQCHVHTPGNGKEKLLIRLQGGQEQRSSLPRSQQRISLTYLNFEGNKAGFLEGFMDVQMGWKSPRCLQCQFSYPHKARIWGPEFFILNWLFLWVYFRFKLEMTLSEIAAVPSGMVLILFPGHLHCGDQRQDPHSPAEECAPGALPHDCVDGAVTGTEPLTRILQSPSPEAFTTNAIFQSWTASK